MARAIAGGPVVGTASLSLPLAENTDMAVVNVSVEPAYRRRGVLSALFAEVDSEVARRGRTKINAWVKYAHPPVPGREAGVLGGNGVTMPSEGDGAVPADDRASGFARSMGMDLWQVERVSRLDVESCAGTVAALGEAARLAAGEAYGVVGWVGAVPDWAVEGYCRMIEKMDTDTPAGGLEWDESVWDESRLRVSEERQSLRGSFLVQTCAIHRPTGAPVAFTELVVVREVPEAVFQEDTLVVAAHWGNRLGMLVKTANLDRVRRAWPTMRRIYTWNADENGHMLAINTDMGFRGVQCEGAWQKKTQKNLPDVLAPKSRRTANLELSADDSVE